MPIADGYSAKAKYNLVDYGGKVIPNLVHKPIMVGNWSTTETALLLDSTDAVMNSTHLNEILSQYMPTVTFNQLPPLIDKTRYATSVFTRATVDAVLKRNWKVISKLDLGNTVMGIMLPPGVILDSKKTAGRARSWEHKDPWPKRLKWWQKPFNNQLNSRSGLGGYHGSSMIAGRRVYYLVVAYSEMRNGVENGIYRWDEGWKNTAAVLYHELQETRTDPNIEEAIKYNRRSLLGWYNIKGGGEVNDIPMLLAKADVWKSMREIEIDGHLYPYQLLWSNRVNGPEA